MYEMFLGPLEQFKPWNTNGIEGVYKFLQKVWRLFHDTEGKFVISNEAASKEELKVLHKTIKRIEEDIERYAFNTPVSTFMICVNELSSLKCHKKEILEPLVICLSPFAPHLCEELWSKLGHKETILNATFPAYNAAHVQESDFEYPVSINGKVRVKISLPVTLSPKEIEDQIMVNEAVVKWLEGKTPKKIIIVPNKIVNLVI
jgi:leucyl-tRNA synthetase